MHVYDNQTEGAACFDPNKMLEPAPDVTGTGTVLSEETNDGFSHHEIKPPFTPVDQLHHHLHLDQQIHINNTDNHHTQKLDPSLELDHQQQQQQLHTYMQNNTHLGIFNPLINCTNEAIAELGFAHYGENQSLNSSTDLLTLLNFPRGSFASSSTLLPSPASGFLGELNPNTGSGSGAISYDQYGYGGLQTNGNEVGNGNGNSYNSLFGGVDGAAGMYQDGDHHHMNSSGIFEFTRANANGKYPKHFVSDKQRRQKDRNKYEDLKSLLPNSLKGDRASIVLDAINYINELKMEVGMLKHLVEKKRISKERAKRPKTEDLQVQNVDGLGPEPDRVFNGSELRSSWIQRKCKDTEIDIRIVDDEVVIKLVQRKKANCLLLSVSRTLDDLQMDLHHVAGGHVGDYYSYLFNTKISEGSSVYASAIANKLMKVMETGEATC